MNSSPDDDTNDIQPAAAVSDPERPAAGLRSNARRRLHRFQDLPQRAERRARDIAEGLPAWLTNPANIVMRTFKEFAADECVTHAAAIAFHTLFGLFPLLLGAGVIVSFFSAGRDAYATVLEVIADFLPAGNSLIEDNLNEAIDLRGPFGILALATLVWSASRIFEALQLGLNAAWDAAGRRPFMRAKAMDIAAVLLIAPLILLSVASTAIIESVRYAVSTVGETVPVVGFLGSRDVWALGLRLIPLATSLLLFESVYIMLPNVRVHWKHALPGAILAAVLFELGKLGFAWYATNLASYSIVYGSLSAVIVLMLWIYISALILLVGAEFSSEFSRKWLGAVRPGEAVSPRGPGESAVGK